MQSMDYWNFVTPEIEDKVYYYVGKFNPQLLKVDIPYKICDHIEGMEIEFKNEKQLEEFIRKEVKYYQKW